MSLCEVLEPRGAHVWCPALVYPKKGPYTPKTVAFGLSQQGAHTLRDPVKEELLSVGDTMGKQNIRSSKPQRTSMHSVSCLCFLPVCFAGDFLSSLPKYSNYLKNQSDWCTGEAEVCAWGPCVIAALGTAQTKGSLLMHLQCMNGACRATSYPAVG